MLVQMLVVLLQSVCSCYRNTLGVSWAGKIRETKRAETDLLYEAEATRDFRGDWKREETLSLETLFSSSR